MKPYNQYSKEELETELVKLREETKRLKSLDLHLNMQRGVPSQEQLDLSMGMMDVLSSTSDLTCDDGIDCRTYGVLTGIPECKKLLGDIIEVSPDNIIIYGNSSLNIMFDCISRSMTHGVMGSTPWCKLPKVKWLCPVPGYDRHFAITEYFGIEMINIPMRSDGPDMNEVERLVSQDPSIKGIWCVPKYSNPDGVTYSNQVVKRFAALKPAAKDFRIYWDNAYSVHHLYEDKQDYLLEILDECKKAGNPDMVYKFTSTSKISFPGGGIAAIATSLNNIADIKEQFKVQTIGHDKVNQLRHVRYFKNLDGIKEQMKKHADILRPKFELVEKILEDNLEGYEVAKWSHPHGGYFISLYTRKDCATEVIARCNKLGVTFTPAGSTYPYHKDPLDNNIRIAPSYPTLKDLSLAIEVLVNSIKVVTIKHLLDIK
jgi:DNA-binding transcriptional MocR family regulator